MFLEEAMVDYTYEQTPLVC